MLFEATPLGLHCERGGFYVDPAQPVPSIAVLTHAHGDHAVAGSAEYVCTQETAGLLQHRLGAEAKVRVLPYGASLRCRDVLLSFHPAGHILGSAQLRVETQGSVW